MANQRLDWRKTNSSISRLEPEGKKAAKYSNSTGKDTALTSMESWRSKGPSAKSLNHHSTDRNSATALSMNSEEVQHRRGKNTPQESDTGPAAPLDPLQIDQSKPLPHPSTYGGSDNWALTPTGSLPSLPGTPSRAMHSMGWNHIALPNEERQRENSGSRELNAARALLLRRNEESPIGQQMRGLSPANHVISRHSPKRSPQPANINSPQMSSTAKSPPLPSNLSINDGLVRSNSPSTVENSSYSTPSPNSFASLTLRDQDSSVSVASSSLLSSGSHPISHSRRTSQVLVASPSNSVSSLRTNGPGYLVYRPPHLRDKNSMHALKPKIAHYDRVRTPSLRGHSRSPDLIGLNKKAEQDGSTKLSDTPANAKVTGRRRLSSLGSFNSSIYEEDSTNSARDSLDSRSLIAKLMASRKNRKLSDASSYRQDEALESVEDEEDASLQEDIDLSADDMMMQSNSLTDEFCLSRRGSCGDQRPVVDIFEIGDRLGPGMMHDGLEVSIAETSEGFKDQNADLSGSQLEVMKKLGEGSYAVVYLVKEVAKGAKATVSSNRENELVGGVRIPKSEGYHESEEGDETVQGSEGLYSTTLRASSTGRLASDGTAKGPEEEGVERETPHHFALKCLCKRDLSDEMLKVQRLEATIHQSIPQHPYIVTLYRVYETAEWLFLILEYCPGQDLYYWLEQAHDVTHLGAETPSGEVLGSSDSYYDGDLTTTEATPPSPSILASTESRYLLSTRRLKLISRMFQQMCLAVSFCHDRGISHRDIKPENFIVEDVRGLAMRQGDGDDDDDDYSGISNAANNNNNIKVKLTDFGLAVAQEQCIDFDCGSKPYMSYECHNNSTRWYDPKQSDIWSLGIVLLNLIFHRSPFLEPNAANCPSFANYVEDPIQFLVTAFRGLKWEAATFLAEKVFCDVSEGMDEQDGPKRSRITAKEFGDWAINLERTMTFLSFYDQVSITEEPGADEEITSPIWHSRSVSPSVATSSRASPATFNPPMTSIHQELKNMGIQQEEWENFGSLFPEGETGVDSEAVRSKSHVGLEGSPLAKKDSRSEEAASLVPDSLPSFKHRDKECSVGDATRAETNIEGDEEVEDADLDSSVPSPSVTTSNGNPKRRKRGARKGRTMTKQELKRSQSVENIPSSSSSSSATVQSLSLHPGMASLHTRDRTIRELAEASQTLAREMSRAKKNSHAVHLSPIINNVASESGRSPTLDTPPGIASTRYKNSNWKESPTIARPASVSAATAILSGGGAMRWDPAANRRDRTGDRKSALEDSGRTANMRPGFELPAPPIMATNWRERNESRDSITSGGSSTFSDVTSIYSTASAPAILAARRQQQSATSTFSSTSSSPSSPYSTNGVPPFKTANNRSTLAATSNLSTIEEKSAARLLSEKSLDASYLAGIFGGTVPQGGSRQRSKAVEPVQSSDASDAGNPDERVNSVVGNSSLQGGRSMTVNSVPTESGSTTPHPIGLHNASKTSIESIDEGATPRKKMLGKFLLGVKNYNKGVKAAPYDEASGVSSPRDIG
ncbi:hypothetical protein CBS101457_000801 [Exobasidium rhododendri]|nr:hypothetical protein CBS101457_000801 [Exobasidium rhododendri]